MTDITATSHTAIVRLPRRAAGPAVKRGLRGRCPACGEGRIFSSYLKVNPSCASCGEELHHHRADDFPAYVTIFVVGHLLGAAFMVVVETWPDLPNGVHFLIWPTLCIVLSLWLLPIFKGGLIAYQWALRMHGFEDAASDSSKDRAIDDRTRPPLTPSAAA